MTCDEAQLLIGADPETLTAALEEHLRGCPACSALRADMLRLNAAVRRALAEPPPVRATRTRRAAPPPPWRQWALAASVVLAVVAALGVWVLRPSDTLASEVVAHVQGEPQSWLATHNVSAGAIDHALKSSGIGLDVSSDRIVYAQSCWFRGHYVPHLVLETEHGPATVLLLRHEHVTALDHFHESGMTGVIVPSGEGSIAVLERGRGRVDQLAGELRQQVHWLPEPNDHPQSKDHP
jgi:uncharacterized protein DUF3379